VHRFINKSYIPLTFLSISEGQIQRFYLKTLFNLPFKGNSSPNSIKSCAKATRSEFYWRGCRRDIQFYYWYQHFDATKIATLADTETSLALIVIKTQCWNCSVNWRGGSGGGSKGA